MTFGSERVPVVILKVRRSSPALDGSTWELVEGVDLKYKYGVAQTEMELSLPSTSLAGSLRCQDSGCLGAPIGGQSYATEQVADLMRQKAAEGLLFAADLNCPRYAACRDDAEQMPHEMGVVFAPDIANVHEMMKDAAIHVAGATNVRPPLDFNNPEDRGRVFKASAGVAMVVMSLHARISAWAADPDNNRTKETGKDVLATCSRDVHPLFYIAQKGEAEHYADMALFSGMRAAACRWWWHFFCSITATFGPGPPDSQAEDRDHAPVPRKAAHADGSSEPWKLRHWARGWWMQQSFRRQRAGKGGSEQQALCKGGLETAARRPQTRAWEHAVYTPLVEKPQLWSVDLIKFLSCHSSRLTGETSQFMQRDMKALQAVQRSNPSPPSRPQLGFRPTWQARDVGDFGVAFQSGPL